MPIDQSIQFNSIQFHSTLFTLFPLPNSTLAQILVENGGGVPPAAGTRNVEVTSPFEMPLIGLHASTPR